MSSQMMDHRNGMSASPYFSRDLQFSGERQAGFWKMDALKNNHGMKTDAIVGTPYKMPVISSSLDKLVHVDSVATKCFENPEHKVSFNLQRHAVGAERAPSRSVNMWSAMDLNPVARSNPNVQLSWDKNNTISSHYENGLFSSSLSDLFSQKMQLSSNNTYYGHSVDNNITSNCEEDEPFESLEEIEAQTIGNLLPNDDDDLLAGVVDGIESTNKLNRDNDVEDLDFFSSVGGMELDDTLSGGLKKSEFPTNSNGQLIEGNISINGEHPFGEVPSRTLFVRNINNNVEDLELQALFEQYGDIRTLYTACKHRGFVMISYFDIRAAKNAMKVLQNKSLRRRRLDIHYSIPKDNPSDKDVNQGTLVAFILDPSVSSEDICQILSVYGEVKEIQEASHISDQKFIEFYDIRAADKALHALNQSDIASKKIKLEPSHPRSLKRSSMQSLPTDLEQGTLGVYAHQSSAEYMQGYMKSTNIETDSNCIASAGILSTQGSFMERPVCHGISSSVPSGLSSLTKDELTSIQGYSESRYSGNQTNYDFLGMPTLNPHSLPNYNDGLANGIPYNADYNMPATVSSLSQERIEETHLGRLSSSVEMCDGFATSRNASGSQAGHHYMWGSLNHYQQPTFMWQDSPSFSNGFSSPHNQPRVRGVPQSPSHMLNSTLPMNGHHVGSAPYHSLWDRRNCNPVGSPHELPSFYQGPPGNMRLSRSPMHQLDFVPHNMFPHVGGNNQDLQIPSRNIGFHAHQKRGMVYPGRGQMNMVSFEHPGERAKSRRSESNTQTDNKKQFELDVDRIRRGEDTRTTLMIKNIPNKYTSKMLMAAIDEQHRGTYDFIYLPIDFKNKCNVGYAFINMIDPSHIISFYETFNGKKWEKFNSEKVASLAYARIQGKDSLIAHFQNSSLMNEDKRCRPILFHNDGSNAGDQVPCPMGVSIRSKPNRSRSINEEDIQQESPPNLGNAEKYSCGDSCSSSGKESV